MNKFASLALVASLGVAGLAASTPAAADGSVIIEVPRIVVGLPVAYGVGCYGPCYYEHGRYWRRDHDRDRYEHERYWPRDRDRYEHPHRDWDRR